MEHHSTLGSTIYTQTTMSWLYSPSWFPGSINLQQNGIANKICSNATALLTLQSYPGLSTQNGKYSPNSWKIVLHFLKLSSIFGNFKMMLLNDFMKVPCNALFCIASTIFASSFDTGQVNFIESLLPTTPPIFLVIWGYWHAGYWLYLRNGDNFRLYTRHNSLTALLHIVANKWRK